jgi:hypothetical protein
MALVVHLAPRYVVSTPTRAPPAYELAGALNNNNSSSPSSPLASAAVYTQPITKFIDASLPMFFFMMALEWFLGTSCN